MQIQSMTFKEEIICFPNLINHETFVTGHLTGQAIQQTALEHAHLPTSLPSSTCWRVEVLFHRLHYSTTNPNGEPEFLCSPTSSERVFYEAIVLGIGKEGLCSSHHTAYSSHQGPLWPSKPTLTLLQGRRESPHH